MINNMKKSGYYKTLTAFAFIVCFLVLFTFTSKTGADLLGSDECIKCHENEYLKAISYTYQHSILREACTHCHVRVNARGETYATMNFSTFQKEQIVRIVNLDPDQIYEAEAMLTDERGARCVPKRIKTNMVGPAEQNTQFADIKNLSDVTIDEVKKGGFVRAVLSWNTDAYSTSEVEYWTANDRKIRFRSRSIFSKQHSVVLNGLRHKSLYTFKAISKDLYGNVLESNEYPLDTSINIVNSGNNMYQSPEITSLKAFTIEGQTDIFLKVFANKASALTVKIIEIKKLDTKHGFGLLDPKAARIDTCTKCHPRGASHPVGVKAEGRKIRTPDELPTIDGFITCVTCHSPHGGDNAFFARYDRNKDICILCHIGGY